MNLILPLFITTGLILSPFVLASNQLGACSGRVLSPPLRGHLEISDPFDLSGASGRPHKGVDYRANHADVLALDDAIVAAIGWDFKQLKASDSRTGLQTLGWGRYILLRHPDGAETLYAHLDKESTAHLKPGQGIRAGFRLGISDSTGGVTGPHLHLEYAPKGGIFSKGSRINPDACVLRHGTISVFSNAKLSGGLFRLSIAGKEIGRVGIGERGTFGGLTLLPGQSKQILLEALETQSGGDAAYGVELDGDLIFLNQDGEEIGHGQYAELPKGARTKLFVGVESH